MRLEGKGHSPVMLASGEQFVATRELIEGCLTAGSMGGYEDLRSEKRGRKERQKRISRGDRAVGAAPLTWVSPTNSHICRGSLSFSLSLGLCLSHSLPLIFGASQKNSGVMLGTTLPRPCGFLFSFLHRGSH